MLGDAINFPIVAALGLVVFAPLVIVVSAVECFVMKATLRVPVRLMFRRVLLANTLSTVAGGLVSTLQNDLIIASGIDASIPSFVRGYAWVACVMILIYFTKSILVEGPCIATRGFAQRLERPRKSILKAIFVANLASYCLVGPLFYVATRPTFGGLRVTDHARWTGNAETVAYFIEPGSNHIRRIRLDGRDNEVVVPGAAAAFLVSETEEAFAYRGVDGNLYAFRNGDAAPTLVSRSGDRFLMDSVSFSPDTTLLAFAAQERMEPTEQRGLGLCVFDLVKDKLMNVPAVQLARFDPFVSWSRSGDVIYAEQETGRVWVVRGSPPWDVLGVRNVADLPGSEFPTGYVRSSAGRWGTQDDWGAMLSEDRNAAYTIRCQMGLGAHCLVVQDDRPILQLYDGYGLMKLGWHYPDAPTLLPNGAEVLLEWWGQLYVLDIENRQLGLLTSGRRYVVKLPRFRIDPS